LKDDDDEKLTDYEYFRTFST